MGARGVGTIAGTVAGTIAGTVAGTIAGTVGRPLRGHYSGLLGDSCGTVAGLLRALLGDHCGMLRALLGDSCAVAGLFRWSERMAGPVVLGLLALTENGKQRGCEQSKDQRCCGICRVRLTCSKEHSGHLDTVRQRDSWHLL